MTDHRTWSYRGGEWFGIFGEHAAVVLPPTEKARVAPLWELVDDGAGFEETLDALVSGGLRDLPGFVLVSRAGEQTRVVLRGRARARLVTADEVVQVEGEGATTWVERMLTGVSSVRIEVGEETAPDDLAVAGGLVRLAVAECPVPSTRSDAAPGPIEDPGEDPGEDPVWDPGEDPGPRTEAMPAVPPPQVPAAPGAPAEADHDGLTRAGDIVATGLPSARPGIPGQTPAPAVTARPVARLLFSSGEDVEVDRVVVVGRAPEPRRDTRTEEPRLVSVASPHQEVSSTHLEIRPGSGADHGTAVVTDLGSTNGTLLLQPGLPPEDLRAGVGVQLIPGAVIDLGDGVSIQVVDP